LVKKWLSVWLCILLAVTPALAGASWLDALFEEDSYSDYGSSSDMDDLISMFSGLMGGEDSYSGYDYSSSSDMDDLISMFSGLMGGEDAYSGSGSGGYSTIVLLATGFCSPPQAA